MKKTVSGHPDLCLSGPYVVKKNTDEEVAAATAYVQRRLPGQPGREVLDALGILDA